MSKKPPLDIAAAMEADMTRPSTASDDREQAEFVGPGYVSPSRRGRKTIQAYVSPTVRKQLHLIALEEGTSIEALIMEGLDLVFRARGKPMIAFDGRERPRSGER